MGRSQSQQCFIFIVSWTIIKKGKFFELIKFRVNGLTNFNYSIFISAIFSLKNSPLNYHLELRGERFILNDDDPLFTPKRKPIKIREYLVLTKEEEGTVNYIIRSLDSSKEDALSALEFLKTEISSFNDLSPIQKLEFCKNQRKLIKLYLKLLNANSSSWVMEWFLFVVSSFVL